MIKQRFINCDNVTTTTDIWSDRKMRAYLGVTAHFVEEDPKNKTSKLAPFFSAVTESKAGTMGNTLAKPMRMW